MPRKTKRPQSSADSAATAPNAFPSIPVEAVLSFLKQTRGLDSWSAGDIAKTLKLPAKDAKQVLAVLEMQGYVKSRDSDWKTTSSGHAVSGSTMPRLQRESVERAIKHLADWIKVVNQDSTAAYRVTKGVAFGDFLNKTGSRVQAADVGIQLEPRSGTDQPESVTRQQSERAFLKHLRGRSPMVQVRRYEEWMDKRPNLKLL